MRKFHTLVAQLETMVALLTYFVDQEEGKSEKDREELRKALVEVRFALDRVAKAERK